jgi:1,5-anhydro-D-fructose reductase (1,5-anhydro-D-mannitol-forming)
VIGWGLAGCGWVGREYVAPAIAASRNGRLVAVLDPNSAARTAVPAPVATGDLEAFLATPGLDAVYVATPNHLHRPLVEAAAAATKAVLCEKPMATTAADAAAMLDACTTAGVRYATAFDQRHHPAHEALARLIAAGALGVVSAVRIAYGCWLPPDWAADNWRVDPRRAGGGAVMDLAPHGLDLVQALVGEPLVDLAGLTQARVFDYPVDDGAALVGRTAGGVLLILHVAYNCPERYPRRRLEVLGTEALAVATDTMGQTPGGTLELLRADGTRRLVPFDTRRSPFLGQVEAFADALLGVAHWPHPPQRDLSTMRLLEGVTI